MGSVFSSLPSVPSLGGGRCKAKNNIKCVDLAFMVAQWLLNSCLQDYYTTYFPWCGSRQKLGKLKAC